MYMILIAAFLFAVSNCATSLYQKKEGNTTVRSMELMLLGSVFSAVYILITGYNNLEFSWFSLLMASLSAINNGIFTYVTIKALSLANLTYFSLFCMSGEMILPSVFSIVFYGEKITLQKTASIIVIAAALFVGNYAKSGNKQSKKAVLFLLGNFVCNGVNGILSKIHQYGKNAASADSYTFMTKVISVVIALTAVLYFYLKKERIAFDYPLLSFATVIGQAVVSTSASIILLYSLLHTDASVLYPLNTGGVIVASVVIDLIMRERIKAKTVVSVALAVVGTVILLL